MTDYLELLLEQREQEEEQGLEWPGTKPRLWPRDRGAEGRNEPGVTYRQEGLVTAVERERASSAREEAGQEQASVQPLTARLERLHRAVERAQNLPGRRGSLAGQPPGGNGGMSLRGQPAPIGAADYAALVDAAFQRDARRYDGPLGLL